MHNVIYLKTSKATYYDAGTGELHVWYKCKPYSTTNNCSHSGRIYPFKKASPLHICHVKNDEQGWAYINNVVRPKHGKLRFLYRCPKDGLPYSPKNGYNKRGNVTKSRGLVIDVRRG